MFAFGIRDNEVHVFEKRSYYSAFEDIKYILLKSAHILAKALNILVQKFAKKHQHNKQVAWIATLIVLMIHVFSLTRSIIFQLQCYLWTLIWKIIYSIVGPLM